MSGIYDVLIRAATGFFVILILTVIIGKKQLGQLTIFTYITGISMGSIAGEMVIHRDIQLAEGITALVVWVVLTIALEILSLKLPILRVALDGEPSIVIKHGEIIKDALKKQRLNIDDLTMLMRTNNVFSVKEIDYAILEPNGQLSILKKAELNQPSKQDLKVTTVPNKFLNCEIIADGKIIQKNLQECGLDTLWLNEQIKNSHAKSVNDILYAELQADGSLFVQTYQK